MRMGGLWKRAHVVLGALMFIGLMVGCDDGAPARVCVEGATQACVCGGGLMGGQTCAPGGQGWLSCDCERPANDRGTRDEGPMSADAAPRPGDASPLDLGSDLGTTADQGVSADQGVEPACFECESTPRAVDDCPECGAGANWGAAYFAHRGVCAYSNGNTGVERCQGNRNATADGQVPLDCHENDQVTYLGLSNRRSYAFQCVEYARRHVVSRLPGWNSIGGNACTWWSGAANHAGVDRHANGGPAAPQVDDLLVFSNAGDVCDANLGAYGHIGVVAGVDPAAGHVVMADQNRGGAPRLLTYRIENATHQVGTFGSYVLKGWLRVDSGEDTCGVRQVFGADDQAYARLVTCHSDAWCDLDAERCVQRGACAVDGDCPAGTACVDGGCACSARRPVESTRFDFQGSDHCWTPGPFIAHAEGCTMTRALSRSPGGERALLMRDFDRTDPRILSPRLRWTAHATQAVAIRLQCDPGGGAFETATRLYLSREGEQPQFQEGFSVGPVTLPCDGRAHTLMFDLDLLDGPTVLGWLRFDPLNGNHDFSNARVWMQSVELTETDRCATDDDCELNQHCSDSACVADVCPAGEDFCSDREVRRCDPRGASSQQVRECPFGCAAGACTNECAGDGECARDQHCAGGVCAADLCEQGALFCSAGSVRRCDARGAGSQLESECEFGCEDAECADECAGDAGCPANQYCLGGSCRDDLCPQRQLYCAGDQLRRCNNNGSDSDLVDACPDGCQAGECVQPPAECNLGERRRCSVECAQQFGPGCFHGDAFMRIQGIETCAGGQWGACVTRQTCDRFLGACDQRDPPLESIYECLDGTVQRGSVSCFGAIGAQCDLAYYAGWGPAEVDDLCTGPGDRCDQENAERACELHCLDPGGRTIPGTARCTRFGGAPVAVWGPCQPPAGEACVPPR